MVIAFDPGVSSCKAGFSAPADRETSDKLRARIQLTRQGQSCVQLTVVAVAVVIIVFAVVATVFPRCHRRCWCSASVSAVLALAVFNQGGSVRLSCV